MTTQIAESAPPPKAGGIRAIAADLASWIHDLGVAEKTYTIVAALVVVTTLLVAVSIQSVRLQTAYRQLLATSATAAINIERVNGLIYAIVMESRGVYMSTDRVNAKLFSDELLKRNRELADVVARWEATIRSDDELQFLAFKKRITQFIEFRKELVRRAVEVSPAAGREWGDNDANRALRSELNTDLETLARIYDDRASEVEDLADQGRYTSFYLFALGVGALGLAALNVLAMRNYVVGPLSEIAKATDSIAAGNPELDIPFMTRKDEIGRLAHAMQNFREAMSRSVELQRTELATAKQRDAVIGQRDELSDKYLATKWQLAAAINSMPQGIIMLDAAANVLAINDQYRKMYGLPVAIKAGSSLREILQHRVENGLLVGNVAKYLAAIVARMAKRLPSSEEVALGDGRVISVGERAMDGGGWVAIHDDISGQRRSQRILERTERFLVTVVENISEAIIAKDAVSLRYVFVNRAAEKMIGMPRARILGKTARELLPAGSAELIERRDRQLIAENGELGSVVDSVESPDGSRRTVAVRRLRIGGPDGESNVLLSMIEDRTGEAGLAAAAP